MFDTALVVMDDQARPVLVIPEALPAGDAFVRIVAGGIDIGVAGAVCGEIREMDDATLAMLGMQDRVGMAVFKGEDGETMPEKIQYVARVDETRF